jgi:5-methylcytosine-specific restriction protein A
MAQDWAKWFYDSPAWQACREAFGESKHWLCERCGRPGNIAHHKIYLTPENVNDPWITLAWANLELLCHGCHDDEHLPRVKPTRDGFAFDANGDLISTDPPPIAG